MIKTQKHISTFHSGIDQDTSVNKIKNSFIFDAENMRIISNDQLSSGAETNLKGNELRLVFDVGDVIIGHCKIRSHGTENTKDAMVFFAYNPSGISSKIYLFEGDPFMCDGEILMNGVFAEHTDGTTGYVYESGYIYANSDLNFIDTAPIKAEGRYESTNLRKVYWVDGVNNMRYMILDQVDSGDEVSKFDINPTVEMVAPTGEVLVGGAYTAGLVQHSYQLYRKNGSATTFSPPSDILPLTGNDGGSDSRTFSGSELGENTGKAVRVTINGLDANYDRVRIVAIHHTEYLIDPIINIIGEVEYDSSFITFIDNGYTVYGTIPIDEFRLFGQTNYIPNYIASKYNYLFIGDVTEDRWIPTWLDPEGDYFWDSRAIRYNWGMAAVVNDNVAASLLIQAPATPSDPQSWITAGWNTYTYDYDGINNYNNVDNDDNASYEYKFQHDGQTLGAEGPNVTIGFETESMRIDDTPGGDADYSYVLKANYDDSPAGSTHVSSQRTEVYRMFIVWYNTKMQYSDPQWICDLRMPTNSEYLMTDNNGLVGAGTVDANYIYPTVTIRNIPVDPDLYGWQIFRCDRDSVDRSVMANGVVSALSSVPWDSTIFHPYSSAETEPYCFATVEDPSLSLGKNFVEIVSPEISFNKNLRYINGDYIRVDGRYVVHGTHFDSLVDGANNRIATLSLGATTAADIVDTRLYLINDGNYQSPGIMYGSVPTLPAYQEIGGLTYVHVGWYTSESNSFVSNKGSSFVAKLEDSLSLNVSTPGIILGSYVRNVFLTQYGGNTYEARSYNSVIPYSTIVAKDAATAAITCYRGDTHITMFAYMRSSIADIVYDEPYHYQQEMVYFPCESSINCMFRLDELQKYYENDDKTYAIQETVEQGLALRPTTYPLELGNLYRYNPVYSKSGNATMIQNTIFDSNTIEYNDVKIMATGKKINNEYFDNWTNLYTNNFIEVDPKYGSLRNIFTINNKLFFGQDKGVGVIAVNDRSIIQDGNKSQLTLGTGGVLERYDYLTTSSGFQNYFDVVTSDNTFYYLDKRNKIVYRLTEKGDEPISEVNGYRSYLKSFGAMTSDCRSGYDPVYKDVFFYITDGTKYGTSVYNEYTSSFNGRHVFTPDRMFNLNDQFYSISNNNVYIHNYGNYGEFYGTISDSTITLIINPDGNNVSRYDVLELRVDVIDTDGTTYLETEQFHHLDVNNNYQTLSKSLTFDVTGLTEDTSKSLIRKWRIPLIPDDDAIDVVRLVDTYLKVKLTRHNDENKKIVLHDITCFYRNTKN